MFGDTASLAGFLHLCGTKNWTQRGILSVFVAPPNIQGNLTFHVIGLGGILFNLPSMQGPFCKAFLAALSI
jgi:hypothetical protein